MLLAALVCSVLILLSVLYYLQGAQLQASELTARQCLETGSCGSERIEQLRSQLKRQQLLPTYLNTRGHYTAGLLSDFLALDLGLDRTAQLAAREQAVADFTEATRARPLSGRAWFALGNDALRVGRFQQAEVAFSNLLDIDPYPPFHLDFLRLALNYSRLWRTGLPERLQDNLCTLLKASDWGGSHIRMAVDYRVSDGIRECLHNARQKRELQQALKRKAHESAR
jgi:tetratricopeptide (TPR) repeat protein